MSTDSSFTPKPARAFDFKSYVKRSETRLDADPTHLVLYSGRGGKLTPTQFITKIEEIANELEKLIFSKSIYYKASHIPPWVKYASTDEHTGQETAHVERAKTFSVPCFKRTPEGGIRYRGFCPMVREALAPKKQVDGHNIVCIGFDIHHPKFPPKVQE